MYKNHRQSFKWAYLCSWFQKWHRFWWSCLFKGAEIDKTFMFLNVKSNWPGATPVLLAENRRISSAVMAKSARPWVADFRRYAIKNHFQWLNCQICCTTDTKTIQMHAFIHFPFCYLNWLELWQYYMSHYTTSLQWTFKSPAKDLWFSTNI